MNRMITMILRVVILELVRRGTNVAIDRFSKRGQGAFDEVDEGDFEGQRLAREQNPIDKREMRQRTRLLRRRF